ncbi:hypothetical protein P152DRAFT_367262, partial [Eremomyces bilateralis CBS 781.70]
WRSVSDSIISAIWGYPKDPTQTAGKDFARSKGDDVASKFLARYGQDMVLRFNVTTAEEAVALAEASNVLFLDVWAFTEDWVDIRIAKDVVPSLLGLLPKSLQHAHSPLMFDLGLARAISNSYPFPSARDPTPPQHDTHPSTNTFRLSLEQRGPQESNIFFSDYQPLSVIHPWMRLLASLFPTHVRLVSIGTSYEGRDILAMRVGVHPTNNEKAAGPRKTIIISGGTHAREWIGTSTVNYLAYSLVTSYGKSSVWNSLLEAFDWVFIPTLNPDGYVYTWENDRLWRKNRQPTSLRFCKGIDLDRSWSFQWGGDAPQMNPCSESYGGEEPFDAVEAQAFRDWAKNETENSGVEFVGIIDLHSYSQEVLYPYSYTCATPPPTLENLQELALGLAKAIRLAKDGQAYTVRAACEGNVNAGGILPRIESGGGSALDWFYHELGVRYAYQIRLRDTGSYGFLLPKENIVPTGREMLDAMEFFGRYMLRIAGVASDTDSTFRETSPS